MGMGVVYLKGLAVDIEDFGAEVERETAVGPFDHAGVGLLVGVSFLIEGRPPAHRVLHFEFQTSAPFFVQVLLFVDLVLVRLGVVRTRLHRQKVGQFHKVQFTADV